ncbi:MAG TPA: Crp/Fnr family transcriptional regulator [Thermoanaerobaculia bacterium]|nr:Crp/Fnr family transcriptional regulator [Thermoanaerobaculia bacterium]
MTSPYNLELQNDCASCPLHHDGRFCDVSDASLASLKASVFAAVYPKGATLFVEGEMPRGVFILCKGRAKLTTSSSEGKTLIMKITAPGEILGASAVILGKAYEVSAETVEPSQVNFIRLADFLALLEKHPDVCLRIAQQLSAKYHEAQREVRSLGLAQTTSEKLAHLILDWAADGEPTEKGTRVKVLLTHEEIGQMLGTTRETVTRLLGDLKRKRIIDVNGSNVYVTRPDTLAEMVSF